MSGYRTSLSVVSLNSTICERSIPLVFLHVKELGNLSLCPRQLLVITSKCESLGVPAPWPCPNLLWVVHSIVFEEHEAKVIVKALKNMSISSEAPFPKCRAELVSRWGGSGYVTSSAWTLQEWPLPASLSLDLHTLRCPGYCITRIQAIMRHGHLGGGGDWDPLYAASKNSPDMWVNSLGEAESWDDDKVPANTFVSPWHFNCNLWEASRATWPWHS